MQDVVRNETITHPMNSGSDLGDIDLFYGIGYVKKEIWVARVNKLIGNGAE